MVTEEEQQKQNKKVCFQFLKAKVTKRKRKKTRIKRKKQN